MTIFKAACVQINSQNNLDDNIARACELMSEAKYQGADIIFTPECVAFMAENNTNLLANSYTEESHPALKSFQKFAAEKQVYLSIGSLAIKPYADSQKLYNRSYLIAPTGKISSYYDKIHLYDADLPNGKRYRESDSYLAGENCRIAALPWGKLGMSVCYDVRFPHLYRHLAQSGADFLSIPAAFVRLTGRAHWEVLVRARAIENGCFVFAAAQTGEHPGGRNTYGHSLIVSPWGEILADGGEKEGTILAEIDTEQIQKTRTSLASLKHDKEFL